MTVLLFLSFIRARKLEQLAIDLGPSDKKVSPTAFSRLGGMIEMFKAKPFSFLKAEGSFSYPRSCSQATPKQAGGPTHVPDESP